MAGSILSGAQGLEPIAREGSVLAHRSGVASEACVNGDEQGVEQAGLPGVHGLGVGGRDVGEREQVQLTQPFPAPHLSDDLVDHDRIIDIASCSDMIERQVLAHEVGDVVRIVVRQTEPQGYVAGYVGTPRLVVVAADGLADVVQQRRKEEHGGRAISAASRHARGNSAARSPRTRERRRSTAATECTSTVNTW